MKTCSRKNTIWISVVCFLLCFALCYPLLTHSTIPTGNAIAESLSAPVHGTLTYSDQSVYEGDILNGDTRTGTGTFTWATGEVYKGTWEEDTMVGSGKMTWPDLGVYEGEFLNNKRQGNGTFTWFYDGEPENGAPVSYTGDWINDKIGSHGTLVLAGIGTYEGDFSKQIRSGDGTFTWLNGDIYTGAWANDVITGEGTLRLADGTVLAGTFQRGVLYNGTVTYNINKGIVKRNVKGGKVDAAVTIKYSDGTIVEGRLVNQAFSGNVTITYGKSGDTYVGNIVDGVKCGKGTYTWKNGAHYVGTWSDDLMSGTGKYYYQASEKNNYLSGNFVNGHPDGTLTYVSSKNLKYKTIWRNGSCVSVTYSR